MSEQRQAAGQWIAKDARERANAEGPFIGPEDGKPVCCLTGYYSVECTESHARLIAAAPDLLAALGMLADYTEALQRGDDESVPERFRNPTDAQVAGAVNEARIAIDRAKG